MTSLPASAQRPELVVVISVDAPGAVACSLSNDPALFPGQRVRAQFHSRDVGAPANIDLTDAIEFYLEP